MELESGKYYSISPMGLPSPFFLHPGVYRISKIGYLSSAQNPHFQVEQGGCVWYSAKDYSFELHHEDTNTTPSIYGEPKDLYKDVDFAKADLNFLGSNDSYLINSLLRCLMGYPEIFSLVWGDDLRVIKGIPLEIKTLVDDIIQAEHGKQKSTDLLEKNLFTIVVELSYLLYIKKVNEFIDKLGVKRKVEVGTKEKKAHL